MRFSSLSLCVRALGRTIKYCTALAPLVVVLLLSATFALPGHAQQATADNQPPAAASEPDTAPNASAETLNQLRDVIADIERRQRQIQKVDSDISHSRVDADIAALKQKRQQQQQKLKEQQYYLEQIATGNVDLSLFEQPVEEEFSWNRELKEVLKPILYELKKLTERPRQIEHLRGRQASLRTRLTVADAAIKEITTLRAAADSNDLQSTLDNLLKEWRNRQHDMENELQLVTFQLNEKLDNSGSKSTAIANALKTFVTGRGLNLLLAILSFTLTFVVLRYISHLAEQKIMRRQNKESRFLARMTHIVLQALTVLLAFFAMLATLYTLGDWLLLTLLSIILVGLAFALRQSIPKYIDQVRLLLNLGAVREGERVIYRGLPWNVSRLNVYSDLVNPSLTGGRIRLPMSEMLNLVSRRWSREEPWFPCKPSDYVILPDEIVGSVMMQTPEVVQLEVVGGGTRQYNTTDFIALVPHNISNGFAVFSNFGLDYGLQEKITDDIPSILAANLERKLRGSEFGEFLQGVLVEFANAGSSSLDLILVAAFNGDGARHYFRVKRFLQITAVETCNEHGWPIPFNQVTVHYKASEAAPFSP